MSELSPEIAREQAHPKGLGTVGHEGWEEGVESEAWILKWAVWKGMGEGGMEGPLQSQGKPDIARPLEGKSVQREVRCWRVGGGEGWSSHLKKPFRVAACGSYFCFVTRKSHPFWGYHSPYKWLCFSGSSASKESTCNVGDPGSIPELGRSPGEGVGYLLQYSWVSLVAQLVKDLPAMRETWVRSLGWEDPLEEGMATHSSILA